MIIEMLFLTALMVTTANDPALESEAVPPCTPPITVCEIIEGVEYCYPVDPWPSCEE